jgi:hypothetical protein
MKVKEIGLGANTFIINFDHTNELRINRGKLLQIDII